MKIWQLQFEADRYDNLTPVRAMTVEELQSFDGRHHLPGWTPLPVKRLEPEKRLALSDAPGFFPIPAFSRRALECLEPLIRSNVEILPLAFAEGDYSAVNVVTVLDAVDYQNAVYKTFRDGKRIMSFQKYAFLPGVVAGAPIFKISDEKVRYAFVSEAFKQTVEENGLTGFVFRLVWDSGEA